MSEHTLHITKAAEVLTAHGARWSGDNTTECMCGKRWVGGLQRERLATHARHQSEALAAAGLLAEVDHLRAQVAAPDEREATPDEAHDIGFSKGYTDGYREAAAEVTTRPAPTVNAAQVEATADYLHVEPLRLRWALAALGLTVTDEGAGS